MKEPAAEEFVSLMTANLPGLKPVSMSPPLESGDRLSRSEFERRYTTADVTKAELIEGVVYVASPLRFSPHAESHSRLVTWLGTYAAVTPHVSSGIEPTIRLDLDNEPQPDTVLRLDESVGGKTHLTPDGYLEGAPELVAEVAASSASIDLGDKKQAYRRNGVQEYIVWQVYENKLDWYYLTDGVYASLPPDDAGIICSQIFPGLWLAANALLEQNMAEVLQVVQNGLKSVEYQDWVNKIRKL